MGWMPICRFRVYGTPRPGGSKKGFYNKKLNRVMIVEACKKNPEWRVEVRQAAINSRPPGSPLLDGCLEMQTTFWIQRPKNHYRTGKNSHLLRAGVPPFPKGKPDLDKFMRSTKDALSGFLYTDDARVVQQSEQKLYNDGGQLPGAEIEFFEWVPDEGPE